MPGLDKTGPEGLGERTGGGFGICEGADMAKKGVPKRDGSGRGRRANAGRGCGGRRARGRGR